MIQCHWRHFTACYIIRSCEAVQMSTSQTNSVTWAWQYVDYVSITCMWAKKKRVPICWITLPVMIYGKHQSDDIAPEKKLILLVYFVILAACLLKGNMNQDFALKWLSIKWLRLGGWVGECLLVLCWGLCKVFTGFFPWSHLGWSRYSMLGRRNDCLDLWKDNYRQ